MQTVLLVIQLMIALALCVVVLMQRSEGGALGIGGGGGGGGFLTGRGSANALTRLTAYLGLAFFASSIALSIHANRSLKPVSVFDTPAATSAPRAGDPAPATPGTPSDPARGGVLDKLQGPGGGLTPAQPRAPQGQ